MHVKREVILYYIVVLPDTVGMQEFGMQLRIV